VTEIRRKLQEKCPFWVATSMKCSLCNGGLFIPLDDHAETFCYTPLFRACRQYALYSENQILLAEKVRKSEENRRKYLRIETSHQITLVKIFESGKCLSHFSSKAKAIDISKGGMRMVTDTPLADNAMVQFFFDDTFPRILNEISGQVEWCNKQIDEPGYQAGLSFKEAHIIEAMGSFLEQHAP
jgi:hypothetical protein